MLKSVVCRTEHFDTEWNRFWGERTGYRHRHRKIWEYHAIAQALYERGALQEGKRGIGFAVGSEPLASLFASLGATIVASDVPDPAIAEQWSTSGQYAGDIEAVFKPELVDRTTFDRRVQFAGIDMRDLSAIPDDSFDFCWSACSLEHLGTLQAGMDFIFETTRIIRPGGVSVHTTEYNLSSNADTIESGNTVIYRQQDLEEVDRQLRRRDAALARLDLWGGDHEADIKADYVPYHQNGREHIKLRIGSFVATSCLLIVQN
jgi:SAM-dependent methyltransferase